MNEKLSSSKGLISNNNNEKYIYLQNIYKCLFERYLISKIDLLKYDNLIKNSELDFGIPRPTKKTLVTNLKEFLNLKYIYIINNFFIEKLELSDLKFLEKYALESNFYFDSVTLDFIERTYKEVIRNNFLNGKYENERYKICYGDNLFSNFVYNDELVIKIIFSRNTKKLEDSEFINNSRKKEKFLDKLIEEIKLEVTKKMGIGCTVLVEKIF